VCNLGNSLKIRNIIARVSYTLKEDCLRAVVNRSSNILGLITLDKLGFDPKAREHNLELVISATVQVASRDNVVASMSQGRNGHELGCLA
jgi:hypothetical protein